MVLGQSILTLLLLAQFSGQPTLTAKLAPRPRLTVGDRFDLVLTVRCNNTATVIGPLADSLGSFLVVDQKTSTKAHAGYNDNICRLSLAGFQAGRQRVPTFAFLVQDGPRTDTLRSDTASVAIASVLSPKMQDINGLKPAEAFPNYWLWIIPGLVAVLAALALLGYRLYRKILSAREAARAPLPPWDEALAALDKIPWRAWLEDGQVKRYYYALSEILKRYIERRYDFNAAEQTSTEIIAEMKRLRTPLRDEFVSFIRMADLVKYAKAQPSAGELPGAIEAVRGMVIRSRPIDDLAVAGAAAVNDTAGVQP